MQIVVFPMHYCVVISVPVPVLLGATLLDLGKRHNEIWSI